MIRSRPARLGALRREARAGAGADDRAARVDLRAQPRERLAARHDAPASISSCSRSAIASANAGSLTSASTSCTSTFEVSTSARIAVEERLVGLGIVEDLALRRDRRDTAERDEEHRRPRRGVQLLRDDAADLPALLGRRPHQGDGRVVDVEVPAREPLRHRVHRAEVDHVERAERDDLRDPALPGGLEPLGHGDEHAAGDEVAELRRRHVERAGDEAASISASIEPPPVPVWWKTSTS